MNKLSVGMYVRTKKGKIAKIINKCDNDGSLHKENFVWGLDDGSILALHSQKVIKASFNIIDLIEVGDYVNGSKVIKIENVENYPDLSSVKIEKSDFRYGVYETVFEKDIKTIVTKEQFESMSYRRGDEIS